MDREELGPHGAVEHVGTHAFRRRRTTFNNALRYAVERDLLTANPLSRIDWEPPSTDDEVDFRYVPEPGLARALIRAVGLQGARGEHLEAFFGCLYYAACARPKAAALARTRASSRTRATRTPGANSSLPRPTPRWARALFRASGGGRVRSTEYTAVWQQAREKVLSAGVRGTPLAEVPYSLRHAGVSLWIRAGVDPVEVARRAGHSVAVLFRFYAKILRGLQDHANELIGKALADQDG